MKMKRTMRIVSVTLLVFLLAVSPSFAASFTADINGLTDQEVVSVTVWFQVGSDFTLTDSSFGLGSAVPDDGLLGWDIVKGDDSGSIVDEAGRGRVYKVDILDYDNLLDFGTYPLVNGVIFSFDYSGTILGLSDIIYLKDNNNGQGLIDLIDTGEMVPFLSLGENHLTFAPVPIPGAIWLLGPALVGLLGIRKKFRAS